MGALTHAPRLAVGGIGPSPENVEEGESPNDFDPVHQRRQEHTGRALLPQVETNDRPAFDRRSGRGFTGPCTGGGFAKSREQSLARRIVPKPAFLRRPEDVV